MSAVRRYGATTLTGRTCGPLMTPALWITASICPRRFTWPATPRVSSRSDRSPTTTAAPRSRRSRTAISRSVLRAWTTTSCPSSSSVCAAAHFALAPTAEQATWPGSPWPWRRREGTSTRLSPLDGLPVSRTRSERGREEAFRGEVEYLGAGAPAVVGGDEVVADGRREREQAARFEVIAVAGDRGELRAQVVHAAVVDAAQALCDRAVAAGPVADGEVDRQQLGGEGKRAGAAGLGPGVAAFALDAVDHLLGAASLPRVEHLLQQRVAIGEG